MTKRLLTPEDFTVEECLVQFYQHEEWQKHPDMWFWHCITCDTGSGRRRQHLRGHKLESDAAYAAKQHQKDKKSHREATAYQRWWWNTYMNTDDVDLFFDMFYERFPGVMIREDMTREQLMEYVQKGSVDSIPERRSLQIGVAVL